MGRVPKKSDYNPVIRIAASNTSTRARRKADYVCSGSGDQAVIQSVINGIASYGGELILEEGVYDITANIQITSSNIKLRGRSPKTILRPLWTRGAPLDYTIRVDGDVSSHLTNVSVSDLSIEGQGVWAESGTDPGQDPDGIINTLYGGCWYQFVDNLQIENIDGQVVGFVNDIRNCINVTLRNITAYQCSGPVALVKVYDLTITGAHGYDVKAVVDLGEVHGAVITNIRGQATTQTSGQHVKGFDNGGSTNINLSNFFLDGFDYGMNLKYENVQSKYLNISNGQIHNSANPLRLDRSGVTTGEKFGPTMLDNITIKNGGGIGINLVGYNSDTTISNCQIESVYGISADGTTNTKIHDCTVKATGGWGIRGGKFDLGEESYNFQAYNNTITAVDAAHVSTSAGIWIYQATDPNVHHNTIPASDYHGIYASQCRRPKINDNELQYAWGNGIVISWGNDSYVDTTRRGLDFECNGNRIRNWFNNGSAGGTLDQKAIAILLSGVTGTDPYNYGALIGNKLLGNGGTLGIDYTSSVDLEYMQIQGNRLTGVTYPIYKRGTGKFGPTCQIRNNIGWKTEASGTATISGGTSVTVTHGLASSSTAPAPTVEDFIVTPANSLGNATKYRVSAATATTFTISVDQNPGIVPARFNWQAHMLGGVSVAPTVPTNVIPNKSEDFDHANWVKTQTTVSADAALSPGGTTTADKIIPSVVAGSHNFARGITGVTNAATYTFSICAKADGYNWIAIYNIVGQGMYFDLANGVKGSAVTASPVASTIVDLGGGWYRCSVTVVTTSTTNTNTIYIGEADLDVTFAGDGTSGVLFWGAQLETGAVVNDYVPMI